MRRNGTIKAKVLLTVLGLLMLTLLVGCGLANYTYIGFILMGVGGGGFLLVILSLIAVSALLEKRRNKAHNFSIEDNAHFKIGRVARCELYKQNVSQTRKQGEHAMLFKIWVDVEIRGKKKTLRFVRPYRFISGESVYIFGDIKKPKECELIVCEE